MSSKHWFTLLKLSAFSVFIGRAYQFIFFDAPFKAIFTLPFIENLIDQVRLQKVEFDYAINLFTTSCGFVFIVAAITALFWEKIRPDYLKRSIIYIGTGIMILLALATAKEKDYAVLQILELFIQISAPVVLLLVKQVTQANLDKIKLVLKIAISATFMAHGLFALGMIYYPVNFVDMTTGILSLTESQAKVFLTTVGILDIITAALLYFPKTLKIGLRYALIWGFITALARVVYGFNADLIAVSIHDSLYGTIYRLPHGLTAGVILLILLQPSFHQAPPPTADKA